MNKEKAKLNRIYNLIIQLLINSNNLLCQIRKKTKLNRIFNKNHDEKFTSADWSIQKMIFNHFHKHFPYIRIIGEEDISQNLINEDYWEYVSLVDDIEIDYFNEDFFEENEYDQLDLCIYLDPIDNTSSLINEKYNQVTLLFGVTLKNSPLFGVIHFFDYDLEENFNSSSSPSPSPVSFISVPNKGVFRLLYISNDLNINSINSINHIKKNDLFTISKFLPLQSTHTFAFSITSSKENIEMRRVFSLFPNCKILRHPGLGYKCIISLLNNSIYFSVSNNGLGLWDICACHAIIKELGGECYYTKTGEIMSYSYENSVFLYNSVCFGYDNEKMRVFLEEIQKNQIEL